MIAPISLFLGAMILLGPLAIYLGMRLGELLGYVASSPIPMKEWRASFDSAIRHGEMDRAFLDNFTPPIHPNFRCDASIPTGAFVFHKSNIDYEAKPKRKRAKRRRK